MVLLCCAGGVQANHMASSNAEVARKAETIMSQADKDGDGVITFDEFVIVSKKFPNVLWVRQTHEFPLPYEPTRPEHAPGSGAERHASTHVDSPNVLVFDDPMIHSPPSPELHNPSSAA